MPKFGTIYFNEDYFGDKRLNQVFRKKSIKHIPLGLTVRGTVGRLRGSTYDAVTFRSRRGNGYYGAELGHIYQDKFKYCAPDPAGSNFPNYASANMRAAVSYWQTTVTAEEKKEWRQKGSRRKRLPAYNMFIRAALKGEISMWVDRGDPAAYDFDLGDLTADGTWRDLDLSTIIPVTAKAVLLMGHFQGNNADWDIRFREKGNTNEINHAGMSTLRNGVERHRDGTVTVGPNRVIEYNADNVAWTTLSIVIRGWWT